MIRRLGLCTLRKSFSREQVDAWLAAGRMIPQHVPFVNRVSMGRNLAPRSTFDAFWWLEFRTTEGVDAYRTHPYHEEALIKGFMQGGKHIIERVDVIESDPTFSVDRPLALKDPVRYAVGFEVDLTPRPPSRSGKGVAATEVTELEKKLLGMPQEIRAIKNWVLGRATGHQMTSPWTHLLELEFEDEAGLKAYQGHPYHQDVVAPYFRPGPQCAVKRLVVGWYRPPASFI